MSNAREDFPAPDRPVTTVTAPCGTRQLTPFRLWVQAFSTSIEIGLSDRSRGGEAFDGFGIRIRGAPGGGKGRGGRTGNGSGCFPGWGDYRVVESSGTSCAQPIGWRILRFMTQTLLALPEDVAEALDRRAPNPADRDHLVAEAIRAYLAWPCAGEDASDLAIINANSAELNAEAEDALSYQVPL